MPLFLKNISPILSSKTLDGTLFERERERERERLATYAVDTLIICITGVFVFLPIVIITIVLPLQCCGFFYV